MEDDLETTSDDENDHREMGEYSPLGGDGGKEEFESSMEATVDGEAENPEKDEGEAVLPLAIVS